MIRIKSMYVEDLVVLVVNSPPAIQETQKMWV